MQRKLLELGEYAAAGLYEEMDRDLFYRKSLGIRRYYENCELAPYEGKALYPSGRLPEKMKIGLSYFHGLIGNLSFFKENLPEVVDNLVDDLFSLKSFVPSEHTVAGNMYTHSMPNYPRILKEGLLSYIPRIEKIAEKDMREGLLHLISGIRTYVLRCVDYLRSVGAEERLIRALEKVPLYPAENIYEALVSWNFVLYLDCCDNLGALGKGLVPYFKGEDVVDVIANLFDNLDQNEGYSMSLDSECPDLAVQCLKACRGKRRPMLELFVDENTPDEVWDAAFEAIRTGGQPAFYNPEALLLGLKERFPNIRDEDLPFYCGGGCTESMFTGLSAVGSLDAGINLPLLLERAITDYLSKAESFEEFYDYYIKKVKETVDTVKVEISKSRVHRAGVNPLPMRTLLIDDCIDKACEYNAGGARYNWSIINFAGLINVIDSMLNVKRLVFEDKKYTAEQMIKYLEDNDKTFLLEMKRQPESHGKDNKEANEFANKLSKAVFETTKGGELAFGEGFLSASIQFRSHADAGRVVGATPDGREAGAPLCDSLAAIFGKDTNGPTALLNSVTSLDLSNALGTPVLNFNVKQGFKNEVMKALILGYMKKGGIQMQVTHASKEELLEAYEHPENYGNLTVRVGGYSEYFNRLTDEMKRMIINRSIQEDV